MSGGQFALSLGSTIAGHVRPRRRSWHRRLHGADLVWSIAFLVPYALIFVAFAVYPIIEAVWMGRDPSLYPTVLSDQRFMDAAVNTALFVGVGVNLQMFFALVLSGFFARRRGWIKMLLIVFLLPWTLPAVPAYLSFHWMLVTGPLGLADHLLRLVFGVEGPDWLVHRWLAVGCDITASIWKWLPLWTVILLGGRMAIPQDLYDAADIDGASVYQRFAHVTVPLLGNLYLVSTLISAIWTFGDYAPALFVSNGGPVFSSNVISLLSFQYAFSTARPELGAAAGLSMLPLLIPMIIVLTRALGRTEVQL
jgi:multiple sugar transport system permease protein